MVKKKFYLTTAIPYVNAKPHAGHALEYVIADAIHRFRELHGEKVRIVSGADENALKNFTGQEFRIFGNSWTKVATFIRKNTKVFIAWVVRSSKPKKI